ncbi:MAG: Uma2 family endonuclease [Planctomycetes bacterium]|nr:Uma2 family endonuclease [Planctomycetota bacterium]
MPRMLVPPAFTADQLLELREPGVRHELVRGELRRMSPSGHWHGAVGAEIAGLLHAFVRAHRMGRVYGAETGFLLAHDPDTVRAPDAAFVRTARVAPPGPGYFPGPPDLAVEVASPSDRYSEVHEKALSWLDHGTHTVWVVEPMARTVTVLRARDDMRALRENDLLDGGDLLPGFSCAVAALFPAMPDDSSPTK